MGIFSFFKKSEVKEDDEKENELDLDQQSNDSVVTIKYGTRMPIEVIFHYVHKDFEAIGYEDAMANGDLKYRETKENIIRNDLKMLFKRVSLRYKDDLRRVAVEIQKAKELYALSSAQLLEARQETYREHIEEIAEMERQLDENDPKMTTMIESYRRGFLKGINAKAENFINNQE